MDKMWALMLHLTWNMWGEEKSPWCWEKDVWEDILGECVRHRINTIVLDVGDGIQFKSHPEVSLPGAWSHEYTRAQIARCKALGITLIPKLNFATVHDLWLGEYHRMISTSVYYKVCRDLILEVAELFGNQPYFHLGMDEEGIEFAKGNQLVIYRQKELIWHDLKFLCDCVRETGATPWIWHNWLFEHPEEFKKRFSPEDVILSPYHYNAFRPEHFTPVGHTPETAAYYSTGAFAGKNIQFVEEDPFFARFHAQAIPNAKLGFRYVPCASVYNKCRYNHDDLVEHFRDNAPDSSVLGFITAPWYETDRAHFHLHAESVRLLDEARQKFYPED